MAITPLILHRLIPLLVGPYDNYYHQKAFAVVDTGFPRRGGRQAIIF